MSKNTVVGGCFCKGLGGVVRGIGVWKKADDANHRKLGITEGKKGPFCRKFALWCQAQAEDDKLQLTVQSLGPPSTVLGTVWCRTEQALIAAVHFDIFATSTHHPPRYATVPNKWRHLLPYSRIRPLPVHYTPPSPFQGDSSVANNSERSTPARQSATNADTYYLTLHYKQARLIMPPPGGQSLH